MSLSRIERLWRSLSGQLVILSLVFLALATTFVVVLPYLSALDNVKPLTRTHWSVQQELARIYRVGLDRDERFAAIGDSDLLAEVAAVNPDFRYYVEDGEANLQFGPAPRWRDTVEFVEPDTSADSTASVDGCATHTTYRFNEDGVPAHVSYQSCGRSTMYYEFGGIENSPEHDTRLLSMANVRYYWNNSSRFIVGAFGVTLIMSVLLWIATRSLRRLAAVADSFDAESLDHVLPVDGLPSEFVPLIEALNGMMGRIGASVEQQSFFLATAAHEMRTPMAVLRNRLEDLPEGTAKDELRDDVRRITRLVEQLLQLMSVRNREKLDGEADLIAIAKSVISDRVPLAVANGVDIELDAQLDSLELVGDQHLLHVAIANLIDNAVSFSRPGDTVSVRIDAKRHVFVQDQGPGIPDDAMDSVFEPFSKNPPNRKGHGLGLAIVKAIVKLHGGHIVASNAPNGGAVFELRFCKPSTNRVLA